jgi:hypothetical protein
MASFGGPLQAEQGRQLQHVGPPPGNVSSQHQIFAPMPHTTGPPPVSSQVAASGIAAVFGGPLQQQQPEGQRGAQQQGAAAAFPGVAPGAHQIPGGMTQGQQPILNVSGARSLRCGILKTKAWVDKKWECWVLGVKRSGVLERNARTPTWLP